jgi:hypothetical protein
MIGGLGLAPSDTMRRARDGCGQVAANAGVILDPSPLHAQPPRFSTRVPTQRKGGDLSTAAPDQSPNPQSITRLPDYSIV